MDKRKPSGCDYSEGLKNFVKKKGEIWKKLLLTQCKKLKKPAMSEWLCLRLPNFPGKKMRRNALICNKLRRKRIS